MTGDAIRRSWDENAARWIETARNDRMPSRAVTNPAVLDAAAALAPKRVLDLGCGEGWLARALAARTGASITGIDGAPVLIEAARAADPDGDYRALSYEDAAENPACLGGPHDLAIANFALFAEDLTPILSAVRQALNAEARLIIQTLHPAALKTYRDGWRVETWDRLSGENWTDMPLYLRTFEGWSAALSQSGFTIDRILEPRDPNTGEVMSVIFVAQK